MSKRQKDGYTILNSKKTTEDVERKIASMLEKVWNFSFQETGNHKSSTKTDELHEKWEKVIYASFGDFEDRFRSVFELETEKAKFCGTTHKISDIFDMYDQKFNVDLMMKLNGEQNTAFLLKAPLTSINKNRYNYIGNLLGEICRFYGNPTNRQLDLVFVNFVPKVNFTIEGDNCKTETTRFIGLSNPDILSKAPIDKELKGKIKEINIPYDINLDFSTIKNKKDLKSAIQEKHYAEESFITVDDTKSLNAYIEQLIVCHNDKLGINLDYNKHLSLSQMRAVLLK